MIINMNPPSDTKHCTAPCPGSRWCGGGTTAARAARFCAARAAGTSTPSTTWTAGRAGSAPSAGVDMVQIFSIACNKYFPSCQEHPAAAGPGGQCGSCSCCPAPAQATQPRQPHGVLQVAQTQYFDSATNIFKLDRRYFYAGS